MLGEPGFDLFNLSIRQYTFGDVGPDKFYRYAIDALNGIDVGCWRACDEVGDRDQSVCGADLQVVQGCGAAILRWVANPDVYRIVCAVRAKLTNLDSACDQLNSDPHLGYIRTEQGRLGAVHGEVPFQPR